MLMKFQCEQGTKELQGMFYIAVVSVQIKAVQ